jgi:hypothetical protein
LSWKLAYLEGQYIHPQGKFNADYETHDMSFWYINYFELKTIEGKEIKSQVGLYYKLIIPNPKN